MVWFLFPRQKDKTELKVAQSFCKYCCNKKIRGIYVQFTTHQLLLFFFLPKSMMKIIRKRPTSPFLQIKVIYRVQYPNPNILEYMPTDHIFRIPNFYFWRQKENRIESWTIIYFFSCDLIPSRLWCNPGITQCIGAELRGGEGKKREIMSVRRFPPKIWRQKCTT